MPAEDGLDALAKRSRPEGSRRTLLRIELAKANGRRPDFHLSVSKTVPMRPIFRPFDRELIAIE